MRINSESHFATPRELFDQEEFLYSFIFMHETYAITIRRIQIPVVDFPTFDPDFVAFSPRQRWK
jgi:hypothetical protein